MTNRVLTRLKMGIFLHASFQLHNRPSSHLLLLYRLMHSANINTPTLKQKRHRENEIFCSRFIFFCSFLASRLLSLSTHSEQHRSSFVNILSYSSCREMLISCYEKFLGGLEDDTRHCWRGWGWQKSELWMPSALCSALCCCLARFKPLSLPPDLLIWSMRESKMCPI